MKKVYYAAFFIFLVGISNAQFTKLFDFAGSNGSSPYGDLYFDGTYLYGTTRTGGANNYGTLFKITPGGTGFTTFFHFNGIIGGYPYAALISDGTYLYGTTGAGGVNLKGTIFKILPNGTGFSKIYDFSGFPDGQNPYGTFFYDGAYLYGTTQYGGNNNNGVLFKVKTDGSGFVKLIDFSSSTNGSEPQGRVISDGTYLYGMTAYGGSSMKFGGMGCGTIYKILANGSGYTKILDFDSTNGGAPQGSLLYDGTFLYGITNLGGANNQGTIFKIMPDGTGYLKLLDFNSTNGKFPGGTLILDGTYLYGMTWSGGANNMGVIFKIKTDGSGFLDVLDFAGTTNGSSPYGSLIFDGSCLYGMTSSGGNYNAGVVFKLGGAVGIEGQGQGDVFSVSPNPASNTLNIEMKNSTGSEQIKITDLLGNEVTPSVLRTSPPRGEKNFIIDVNSFANGVYFISISNGNSTSTQKFIVQH